MKINTFKTGILSALLVSVMLFVSCDESIDTIKVDEDLYKTSGMPVAYTVDNRGKLSVANLEFRTKDSISLFLSLSKPAGSDVKGNFVYNKAVLDKYNEAQGTNYEAFPEGLISIVNEFTLATGAKKSGEVKVKVNSSDVLDATKTYVIPVSVNIKSGSVKLSETSADYLVFVKDLTKVPTADKTPNIKIISCMEVNDTNPLNNLCFTLKKSGKPLIDMVILFSANINYSPETGRVYVFNNENVQHLLDNREKYIKPLQDRGIKVVLSILGNHDRSGVANLADETAKAFAQEMKAVCDAYNLDGIFFDDEYSAYQNPAPKGFVSPSSEAASRLCYETKKAMPNKLVCAYVYGRTSSLPAVEETVEGKFVTIESGTFVDYGIHDYRAGSDLSGNYPGMPKSNMALYSQEFARGYWASASNLEHIRNNGYGSHMIFAMDPNRGNFSRQKQAMELIAEKLFDDELVYSGEPYSKDW